MKDTTAVETQADALPRPTEWIVLHLVFALTGVLHVVSGALLPAIAAAESLRDNQSGLLFLCYFLGSALGAMLCIRRHALLIAVGFLSAAGAMTMIATCNASLLWVAFLWMGTSMGMPLSSVSILAGRRFGSKSAAPLTMLNFIWSGGALAGPLVAAQLLVHHSYRTVYALLAGSALLAAAASWRWISEPTQPAEAPVIGSSRTDLHWILLFAVIAFLVVGIENTSVTWMAIYAQRTLQSGAAAAAATSSLYWGGYLASRAISSLLLMKVAAQRMLIASLTASTIASCGLVLLTNAWQSRAAMLLLGASLAPLFPLMLASLFARVRNAAASRWVLACSGFGGSLLPWLAGFVSNRTGSLRVGLAIVPIALLLLLCSMPLLSSKGSDSVAAHN